MSQFEKSFREVLGKVVSDDTILEYLLQVAMEDEATKTSRENLNACLGNMLTQFNLANSEEEAIELLKNVKLDEETNKKKANPATLVEAKTKQPTEENTNNNNGAVAAASAPMLSYGDSEDDWGTKVMPIRSETNVIVERIESAAEKKKREKKENKASLAQQREIDKELKEIQYENSIGVAHEITASVSQMQDKKSTGDVYIPNLSISVGNTGKELLSGGTLRLAKGMRYGLIGRNGCGKSTLLTRISRRTVEGIPKDLSILYVNQDVTGNETTAVEVVLASDPMLSELRRMEKKANLTESEMREFERISVEIDANTAESRARSLLYNLGFTKEMQDLPTKSLSGGWRMRAALASALFYSPDLLLLDEPTNGLSLDAVIWLENYIQTSLSPSTTLVVVSHDRVFLNAVVNYVILFEQQQLEYFKGDVDAFEKTKQQRRIQQQRSREAKEGQIAHMQKFVDRFRYNAKRASLAQSRLKAISRLEAVMEDEVFSQPEMIFEFPHPISEIDGIWLRAEGVSFGYSPTNDLFKDVDFQLECGSKVCLLGANGQGKSTFLKVLFEDLKPKTGFVSRKSNIRIATFAQHHVDQLDLTKTPLEFLMGKFPGSLETEVRPQLARFGITAELATHRIGTLSGGQKSRVCFALVTWTRPHVLLLDEPTSHLDIETADALIAACANFEGALLIISHDQNLISSVPEELWVLENKKIKRFEGDDFLEYKKSLFKKMKKR